MANNTNDSDFIPEPGKFFQNIVFLKQKVKTGIFKKEYITFPIYSNIILTTFDEATRYAPIFIKELISKGDLPEEAIINNIVNEDVIQIAIHTIKVGAIEYAI